MQNLNHLNHEKENDFKKCNLSRRCGCDECWVV